MIGNVDTTNAQLTEHFLTLSVFREGRQMTLSRYHDFDYAENGPDALARFLKLALNEIFPIRYDIRALAHGDPAALQGQINKEPRERLSRAEILALAIP